MGFRRGVQAALKQEHTMSKRFSIGALAGVMFVAIASAASVQSGASGASGAAASLMESSNSAFDASFIALVSLFIRYCQAPLCELDRKAAEFVGWAKIVRPAGKPARPTGLVASHDQAD